MTDEGASPVQTPVPETWLETTSGKLRHFSPGAPTYRADFVNVTGAFRERRLVRRALGVDFFYRYARKAGCPQRILRMPVDSERHRDTLEAFVESCDNGGSLLMAGPTGTGKTVLAVRCIFHYAHLGEVWIPRLEAPWDHGHYAVSPSCFTTAQRLYRAVFQRRDDVLHRARTAGLLVIDDWGAQYEHEWPLSEIDGLVDHRYATLRPTVVTTNLFPRREGSEREAGGDDSFEALYPRAFSRLCDPSGPGLRLITGPDLRLREA